MLFVLSDSLKNLVRYKKRYLLLGILLLGCALLSAAAVTLASAAKLYLENVPLPGEFDAVLQTQRMLIYSLDSKASLAQAGILLVSAIALFFASSAAVGERLGDAGILYAIGLGRGRIFGGMLLEIAVLAAGTMIPGYAAGRSIAQVWLRFRTASGVYPAEILTYPAGGSVTAALFLISVLILLLPVGMLTVKIMKADPVDWLKERKQS